MPRGAVRGLALGHSPFHVAAERTPLSRASVLAVTYRPAPRVRRQASPRYRSDIKFEGCPVEQNITPERSHHGWTPRMESVVCVCPTDCDPWTRFVPASDR